MSKKNENETKNGNGGKAVIDHFIRCAEALEHAEADKKEAREGFLSIYKEPATYASSDGIRGVRFSTQDRMDTGKDVERALAGLMAKKKITAEQFEKCFEMKLSAPKVKALAETVSAVSSLVSANTKAIPTLAVVLVKADK